MAQNPGGGSILTRGLNAGPLQSLMTSNGFLNPYTLNGTSYRFRMPISGHVESPFKTLVRLSQVKIRPGSDLADRSSYKGIVLAVDSEALQPPHNTPLYAWYAAKHKGRRPLIPKFLTYWVRIPELHTMLPCPQVLLTNMSPTAARARKGIPPSTPQAILLHPKFYVRQDQTKITAKAGDLVEVKYFDNHKQDEGGELIKQLYFNEGGLQGCATATSARSVFPCHGKLTCGPDAPEKQKEDIRKKISRIRQIEAEILSRKKTECAIDSGEEFRVIDDLTIQQRTA